MAISDANAENEGKKQPSWCVIVVYLLGNVLKNINGNPNPFCILIIIIIDTEWKDFLLCYQFECKKTTIFFNNFFLFLFLFLFLHLPSFLWTRTTNHLLNALRTLQSLQTHTIANSHIYMHALYLDSPFCICIVINLRFECFCFAYSTFIFFFCSFPPPHAPISRIVYYGFMCFLICISISCQWVSGPVMRRLSTGRMRYELNICIRNVLNAERSRLKATLEWFNCICWRTNEPRNVWRWFYMIYSFGRMEKSIISSFICINAFLS